LQEDAGLKERVFEKHASVRAVHQEGLVDIPEQAAG
jgi:hypothetical protein